MRPESANVPWGKKNNSPLGGSTLFEILAPLMMIALAASNVFTHIHTQIFLLALGETESKSSLQDLNRELTWPTFHIIKVTLEAVWRMVDSFGRTAITKYQSDWVAKTTKINFLTVGEDRSPRSKCAFFWSLSPWFVDDHLFPVSSCCPPSVPTCVQIPSSYKDTSYKLD